MDESAGTFTVQDSKGKDYVLIADPTLGSHLSDVKAPSGPMVATKIEPVDSMKSRTR